MDVTLVTEGTYPHVHGGVSVWCDQMVKGLKEHRFHLVALSATGREPAVYELPENIASFQTVPIWTTRRVHPTHHTHHRPRVLGRSRSSVGSRRTSPKTVIALLEAALSADSLASERFETALFELFLQLESDDLARVLQSDAVAVALGELWHRFDGGLGPKLPLADAMVALDLIEHALRPLAFTPPRADLTHAVSNGLAALVGLTAKWLHGTPLIIAEHGVYLRERYLALRAERLSWPVKTIVAAFTRRLCEVGYRAADLITPCNEYNQRWERRLGADPKKLRTVYNGVDPARFPVAGPEPEVPTLVFVGRIDPLKDIITLIRAFGIVREQIPEARLRLYGTAPKGGAWYQKLCTDLVEDLGLQDSITFEGQSSSVGEAYASGHVVVLSSISEGLPFTILEAMACGRPNIGTEVGGVGEAIGDTGLVVPPRRPGDMARACVTLLTDHELRRKLGKAARERALAMFTIDRAVRTFDGLYRAIAAGETPLPDYGVSDGAAGSEIAVPGISVPQVSVLGVPAVAISASATSTSAVSVDALSASVVSADAFSAAAIAKPAVSTFDVSRSEVFMSAVSVSAVLAAGALVPESSRSARSADSTNAANSTNAVDSTNAADPATGVKTEAPRPSTGLVLPRVPITFAAREAVAPDSSLEIWTPPSAEPWMPAPEADEEADADTDGAGAEAVESAAEKSTGRGIRIHAELDADSDAASKADGFDGTEATERTNGTNGTERSDRIDKADVRTRAGKQVALSSDPDGDPRSELDDELESDLDSALSSNLDSDLDSGLDSDLDSGLGSHLDLDLDLDAELAASQAATIFLPILASAKGSA
jgi:glycosyltransferase involved in cell wall biosynthesis